ncbi:hypothetical protein FGO68_gene5634 [Halteria grandinella]|uniref:Uncharacterized protein n=1 Tax=Halteria grandinella TaxID=5974 RepID=A0A8J8T8K0_HALGN|nr:hypothetical protein FGO68_gene5634 [Halteria grandinella]
MLQKRGSLRGCLLKERLQKRSTLRVKRDRGRLCYLLLARISSRYTSLISQLKTNRPQYMILSTSKAVQACNENSIFSTQ